MINHFDIEKDINNKGLNQIKRIRKNDDIFDRNQVNGFLSASQRETTPLMIFPVKNKFHVCHMIPYKYSGSEDDTLNLFGASSQVNQDMREAEKQLDKIISLSHDALYNVNVNVEKRGVLKVTILVYDETIAKGVRYDITDDDNYYIYEPENPESKEEITKRSSQNDSSKTNNIITSSEFSKQWNQYKETITLDNQRQVEGVQMTYYTFVDIHMNKYYHKNNVTINDRIEGKNWIFSQYLLSLVNMHDSVVAYTENYDDKLILKIIEDRDNHVLDIQGKIESIHHVLDLSEIRYIDTFTYELYRRSHSKLFKRTWELKENEFSEIDEDTMSIYPVEQEDGSKSGFELNNTSGMLVTGLSGSGKTESVKNMLMSFIHSNYVDVGIIDMKASYDWEIFEPYINILINDDVKVKGAYYIRLIEKEISERYKIMKEHKIKNFWDLPKEQRPFNFKIVIIDELQELASGHRGRFSNEFDSYIDDVIERILKKARASGIFIIGITQSQFAVDYKMRKQFHHNIFLRNNGDYVNNNDDKMRYKIASIPKTNEGVGIAVTDTLINTDENEYPLIRFGYYKHENIEKTLQNENIVNNLEKEKIINHVETKDESIMNEKILENYHNLSYQAKNGKNIYNVFDGQGLYEDIEKMKNRQKIREQNKKTKDRLKAEREYNKIRRKAKIEEKQRQEKNKIEEKQRQAKNKIYKDEWNKLKEEKGQKFNEDGKSLTLVELASLRSYKNHKHYMDDKIKKYMKFRGSGIERSRERHLRKYKLSNFEKYGSRHKKQRRKQRRISSAHFNKQPSKDPLYTIKDRIDMLKYKKTQYIDILNIESNIVVLPIVTLRDAENLSDSTVLENLKSNLINKENIDIGNDLELNEILRNTHISNIPTLNHLNETDKHKIKVRFEFYDVERECIFEDIPENIKHLKKTWTTVENAILTYDKIIKRLEDEAYENKRQIQKGSQNNLDLTTWLLDGFNKIQTIQTDNPSLNALKCLYHYTTGNYATRGMIIQKMNTLGYEYKFSKHDNDLYFNIGKSSEQIKNNEAFLNKIMKLGNEGIEEYFKERGLYEEYLCDLKTENVN